MKIISQRCVPGVLVLDSRDRLLYSNARALEMLAALPGWDPERQLPGEVYRLCAEVRCNGSLNAFAVIRSEHEGGGPDYALRALMLATHGGDAATHVMVLMERVIRNRQIDLDSGRERFGLSKRETEVVGLICQGLGNKEISEAMFISELTVKDHIKNIMRKMGAGSRNEIIAALL